MDKGNENKNISEWKLCADLAIAWNCRAVARKHIFNNANYNHWRVSQENVNTAY